MSASPIVISGLGVLTPIGNGCDEFTRGLREGRNGVRPISGFDASRHRVWRAAEVTWTVPEGSLYGRATEMAWSVLALLDRVACSSSMRHSC